MSESFSTFAAGTGAISTPLVSTDAVLVTRAGTTYQVPPTQFAQAGPNYSYQQPASGATLNAASGLAAYVLDPAAGIAALTVGLPGSPPDGFIFEISTTAAITTLTITAQTGSIIGPANFALAANAGASYRYRAANTSWYRRY